jgi:hypothetical protein
MNVDEHERGAVGIAEAPSIRTAFLDGVKAAFVAGQFNRIGQVLCASCGRSWDEYSKAFADLQLRRVADVQARSYDGRSDLGADHPNNLLLVCDTCL